MGGHSGGEVASALAVKALEHVFKERKGKKILLKFYLLEWRKVIKLFLNKPLKKQSSQEWEQHSRRWPFIKIKPLWRR